MKTTTAEFDHPTRGKKYKKANDEMPFARRNEINLMLDKIAAKKGEIIADFGCGSGVITYLLSKQVGSKGRIFALDNSKEVLRDLLNKKVQNIQTVVLRSDKIPLEDDSVDVVATLSNLHHIPDKGLIFEEFSRVLRKGGRLVASDVANKTKVQKYFDVPVDKFCSTGHKHKFLDKKLAKELCNKSHLRLMEFSIYDVPWVFDDEEQAKWFLHTIHDATCTPEECLKEAKNYLGYSNEGRKFLLNWKLFYLIAKKL